MDIALDPLLDIELEEATIGNPLPLLLNFGDFFDLCCFVTIDEGKKLICLNSFMSFVHVLIMLINPLSLIPLF